MSKLTGACVFGQSGGPTSVINASAYGVISAALNSEEITQVLGAAHGVKGILSDTLYDLGLEDIQELELLKNTPSSELGSCRYKLADPEKDDTDYKRILEVFKKHNVRYFFYNGGNDSMDTCAKISRFMHSVDYDCRVIGIPKTIDNDLWGTDHCPGFGSAARFIATTCMEIDKDARVYDNGQITVIEIMGRHAGWLTGAATLATYFGSGPDLIYFPEVTFDMDAFLEKVETLYKKNGKVIIAASEGITDSSGRFISEYGTNLASETDAFGHSQLGGLATTLANILKKHTGAKTRGIELSLMQRCAAHCASQTDIDEAVLAGKAAVKNAIAGESGKMVAFKREYIDGKYTCKTKLIELDSVANLEKKVPTEWILPNGEGVTKEFIDYILPLIQGEPARIFDSSLPRFAKLKKIVAE